MREQLAFLPPAADAVPRRLAAVQRPVGSTWGAPAVPLGAQMPFVNPLGRPCAHGVVTAYLEILNPRHANPAPMQAGPFLTKNSSNDFQRGKHRKS